MKLHDKWKGLFEDREMREFLFAVLNHRTVFIYEGYCTLLNPREINQIINWIFNNSLLPKS